VDKATACKVAMTAYLVIVAGLGAPARADTPQLDVFVDSSRVDKCGDACYDHTHKLSATIEGKKLEWEWKVRRECARCWYSTNGSGSCSTSCDDLKSGGTVQCKVRTVYGEETITLPPEPAKEYRRVFCECAGAGAQLEAAERQGETQLVSACHQLSNDLAHCPEQTRPYCAISQCFGSGQAFIIQSGGARAPGVARLGQPIIQGVLPPTAASTLPEVRQQRALPAEPVLITKVTCAPLLYLMREAEKDMNAMGMKTRQRDQKTAIECVEDLCKSRTWPTTLP